jgi:hypothetical protein
MKPLRPCLDYRILVKTAGNFHGPPEATLIFMRGPGILERGRNLPDIPSGAYVVRTCVNKNEIAAAEKPNQHGKCS